MSSLITRKEQGQKTATRFDYRSQLAVVVVESLQPVVSFSKQKRSRRHCFTCQKGALRSILRYYRLAVQHHSSGGHLLTVDICPKWKVTRTIIQALLSISSVLGVSHLTIITTTN